MIELEPKESTGKENKIPEPVLFKGNCTECHRETIHVSHIARKQMPNMYRVMSSTVSPALFPICTCLQCGKTTYRGGLV